MKKLIKRISINLKNIFSGILVNNNNWLLGTMQMVIICSSSFAQENPEIIMQVGHVSYVTSLAFSPDGSKIVSGSSDESIKLWDVETGKEMRTFKGHSGNIKTIVISPDAKYIFSGAGKYNEPGEIKQWDIKTGQEIKSFDGHEDWVNKIVFSLDGQQLISAGNDKTVRIWNIGTGSLTKTYQRTYAVNYLALSPDGSKIISDGDKSIVLWNLADGSEIFSFTNDPINVNAGVFTPDGTKFISGGGNSTNPGEIFIWDVASGKKLLTFAGHKDVVTTVALSPNGKRLISGSADKTIRLWDIQTGKEIRSYKGHTDGIEALVFSPDGKKIVSSSVGDIRIWDVETGKIIKLLGNVSTGSNFAAFSIDGSKIISGGNKLILWDALTGKQIKNYKGHTNYIEAGSISFNNKKIVSVSTDSSMKVWDTETGNVLFSIPGFGSVCSFSPDGSKLLKADKNLLTIFNAHNGTEIRSSKISGIRDIHGNIKSASFSPDGKTIITGGGDLNSPADIKLWDVETGYQLKSYEIQKEGLVYSLAFSPDGKKLVMSLWNYPSSEIFLCDVESGKMELLCSENAHIESIAFSPDGAFIVSGGTDNNLYLRDVATGNITKTFAGHLSHVSSVSFSCDGKKIVSASWDNTVRVWNVETEKEILRFVSFINDEWIVLTPDGYFDASMNGGELVPIVKGMEVWGIDQFAVKYNRPDIIIKNLGSQNQDMIDHFYNQFKKRLKKLNLTEEQLASELHTPSAKILVTKQLNKYADISFTLDDSKYNLKKYNIYVNNVPLFGAYGKDLTGNSVSLTEKIELISGENKIEISCMNEKGAESFRALTYIKYNQTVIRNLYFLGFGVSNYKNPQLNLRYADKDAQDMATTFDKMKGKKFANVFSKIYVNEQVSPEAIKAAKDFVKNAKVDDTFILFIAGHGMHDSDPEATYYFLTSNADLKNLKGTAADFETIEDLLQGIPPRNKLFLMDACESGELDDETYENLSGFKNLTGLGIASRGFKKVESEKQQVKSEKRTYLYQKDRYIYNDLVRRSGAIVFSSSKGGELSYERSDIENGLFTEYIMKALTTTKADKDGNGIVSTDELRNYVSAEVAKASGDLQHPTVDRDNIYQKFGFQVK